MLVTSALVVVSASHLLLWTYDDRPFWQLEATFAEGKMRGVVTTEERRRNYSGITSAVRARTDRGDFILAYDDLAWVYYLTETRPAMRSSLLATGRFPEDVEVRWLNDMRQRGRTPRIVVTQHTLEGNSPFVRFIAENYTPVSRSGAMVLWESKRPGENNE